MKNEPNRSNHQVQNDFLNGLRKRRTSVRAHLSDGITLGPGLIVAFDTQVVALQVGGERTLVYKASIWSIHPMPKPLAKPLREKRPSVTVATPPKEVTKEVKRRRRIKAPVV